MSQGRGELHDIARRRPRGARPGGSRRRPRDPHDGDRWPPAGVAGGRRRPAVRVRPGADDMRPHRGRAPVRRPVPGAPRGAWGPAGGDARVLRLEQGVRVRRRELAPVPRAGATRGGRRPARGRGFTLFHGRGGSIGRGGGRRTGRSSRRRRDPSAGASSSPSRARCLPPSTPTGLWPSTSSSSS